MVDHQNLQIFIFFIFIKNYKNSRAIGGVGDRGALQDGEKNLYKNY
jgi:hypothetical protein